MIDLEYHRKERNIFYRLQHNWTSYVRDELFDIKDIPLYSTNRTRLVIGFVNTVVDRTPWILSHWFTLLKSISIYLSKGVEILIVRRFWYCVTVSLLLSLNKTTQGLLSFYMRSGYLLTWIELYNRDFIDNLFT